MVYYAEVSWAVLSCGKSKDLWPENGWISIREIQEG
jgi:hypothetical protein